MRANGAWYSDEAVQQVPRRAAQAQTGIIVVTTAQGGQLTVTESVLTPLQTTIINIVKQRQRNVPPTRGVLPKTVGAFLDEYKAEQTLRRLMSDMARRDLLIRVGDIPNSRKGYRVDGRSQSERNPRPALVEPAPRRAEWTFQFIINVPVRVA